MLTQRESAVMAELARKPLSPLRDEVAESPRPHPVAPLVLRAKERSTAADNVRKLRRRQRVRSGLFALLPIVLLLGGYFYVTGGQVMSTDDAYVQAERVGISTDVSGIVQDVDVKDNQRVEAGQLLYRLDPRQFQIALDTFYAIDRDPSLDLGVKLLRISGLDNRVIATPGAGSGPGFTYNSSDLRAAYTPCTNLLRRSGRDWLLSPIRCPNRALPAQVGLATPMPFFTRSGKTRRPTPRALTILEATMSPPETTMGLVRARPERRRQCVQCLCRTLTRG
jgi:hypothetical protein